MQPFLACLRTYSTIENKGINEISMSSWFICKKFDSYVYSIGVSNTITEPNEYIVLSI